MPLFLIIKVPFLVLFNDECKFPDDIHGRGGYGCGDDGKWNYSSCVKKRTMLNLIDSNKKDITLAYELYNGLSSKTIEEIENISGNKIIHTIQEAEPIGPKNLTDIMLVAPCSRKHTIKAFIFYK